MRFLLDGSSQDQTQLDHGRAHGGDRRPCSSVGACGLVVIGVGVAMAVKGVKHDHADDLETTACRPAAPAGGHVGVVGLIGRGASSVLSACSCVRAAVLFDPAEAKGLDAVLQTVAAQPYGKVLLALAVVGILAYAAVVVRRDALQAALTHQHRRAPRVLRAHQHVAAARPGRTSPVVRRERRHLPVRARRAGAAPAGDSATWTVSSHGSPRPSRNSPSTSSTARVGHRLAGPRRYDRSRSASHSAGR